MIDFLLEIYFFLISVIKGNKDLSIAKVVNSQSAPKTILLVSGFGSKTGVFERLYLYLKDRYSIIPINTGNNLQKIEVIAAKIKNTVDKEKIENAVIIAHSLGGISSLYYLNYLEGWKKVSKLITINTPWNGTIIAYPIFLIPCVKSFLFSNSFLKDLRKNGGDKIISIFSKWDEFVIPNTSSYFKEAKNLKLKVGGHTTPLFSKETFQLLEKEIS